MKTEYSVFLLILVGGFVIFLIIIFQIPIVQNLIAILFFSLVAIALITMFWATSRRKPSTGENIGMTTMDAFVSLQEEWKARRKETIKWDDSSGVSIWFGDKFFSGFTGIKGFGEEAGKRIVAVIQHNPFNLMWQENPSQDEIRDPFKIMQRYLHGSPVKAPPIEYPSGMPEKKEPLVRIDQKFPKQDDEIEKFRQRLEDQEGDY